MTRPIRSTMLACVAGSLMAASLLAGCSKNQDVSYSAIRGNLTPEMRGVTDSKAEAPGYTAYMVDIQSRQFIDDFKRSMYWDNPTHLDPRPIIDVSGDPR